MAKKNQQIGSREPISGKIHKGKSISLPDGGGSSIAMVLQGNGRVSAGGKSYLITEGDVLIPIDREAHVDADGDGIEIAAVDFMSHIIGEELAGALLEKGPIYRNEGLRKATEDAIEAIHKEIRSKERYTAQASAGRLILLATEIARAENQYEGKEEISSQVAAAIAYITGHYQEKISLGDLAAVADVSPAYLSRRFTKEMGVGYADYVSLYRLRRAERMLREEPEKSVTEIAFVCGFNDSNYFSDKFKKHFGVAPLKYRKSAK